MNSRPTPVPALQPPQTTHHPYNPKIQQILLQTTARAATH